MIDAGERFDFVLRANQTVSTYWIRLHGLMDCFHKRVFQAALLRYEGAAHTEPEDELTYENTARPGKVYHPRLDIDYRIVNIYKLYFQF